MPRICTGAIVRKEGILRTYETVFIMDPEISDEDVDQVTERYKEIMSDFNGKIVRIEKWGRRKLAYRVKKRIKGNYILLVFHGDHQLTRELERNFRLDDRILKYLTVKIDDHPDLDSVEDDEPKEKEEIETAEEKGTEDSTLQEEE